MGIKKDSKKIKQLKEKARKYSIKEGIFNSIKTSLGDSYISPFAIAINSSNSMVAMLTAMTGLVGPLSQLFSSRLMETYSRKKIILKAVFFESLIWLPFIFIALLFYKGILVTFLPFLLLFLFAVYTILYYISQPTWFSWIGDLVDEKYRGRWFSKRNLLIGFVSVVMAIIAAFFLDYFKKNNWTMFGFAILFLLALIFRLISWKTLKKQYEPKLKLKKSYYFSFWDFILEAPKNNFGKLAIFRFFFTFSTVISSSLLAVYLLRYLNFSYTIYMIIIFSGTIFSLIILGFWGKFTDKYGNYKLICIISILLPITPFLWILNESPIYLIFVPSLINGISWAGLHLAEGNFIYDNVTQQKRGLAISYYNMFWGLGVFLGAATGAILIKFLKLNTIEPIIAIFIIGGLARIIVVFFFLPKIKEIRKKRKFHGSRTFKNIILKQAGPTLYHEFHEIMSIRKYLKTK